MESDGAKVNAGELSGSNGPGVICLAVYRPQQDLLVKQINSIRSQTVSDWQCLIGIDGRDERAFHEVKDAIGDDRRFSIREYKDRVGFYRNFERLLQEVPDNVAWVALSDQDDYWFPDKTAQLLPMLSQHSLATGQVRVVDAHGHVELEASRRRMVPLESEFIDNQVTGSACIFRRELLNIALPFPEATDLAFHDHWLGVCALMRSGISVSSSAFQDYVQHSTNVIGEERTSSLLSKIKSLRTKAGGPGRASIQYLRDHRWLWRVNMARQLKINSPDLDLRAERVVTVFARGRISPRLLKLFALAILRRDVRPSRAIGLLVGAAIFRN